MSRIIESEGITVIELGPQYDSLHERVLEEFGEVLLVEATHVEPPLLVLDFSQTALVGSRFIELLIQAWKRLRQRSGTMVLCCVQPFCAEVLRTTRLDTVWSIYATRSEAIAGVRES